MPDVLTTMREFRALDAKRRGPGLSADEEQLWSKLQALLLAAAAGAAPAEAPRAAEEPPAADEAPVEPEPGQDDSGYVWDDESGWYWHPDAHHWYDPANAVYCDAEGRVISEEEAHAAVAAVLGWAGGVEPSADEGLLLDPEAAESAAEVAGDPVDEELAVEVDSTAVETAAGGGAEIPVDVAAEDAGAPAIEVATEDAGELAVAAEDAGEAAVGIASDAEATADAAEIAAVDAGADESIAVQAAVSSELEITVAEDGAGAGEEPPPEAEAIAAAADTPSPAAVTEAAQATEESTGAEAAADVPDDPASTDESALHDAPTPGPIAEDVAAAMHDAPTPGPLAEIVVAALHDAPTPGPLAEIVAAALHDAPTPGPIAEDVAIELHDGPTPGPLTDDNLPTIELTAADAVTPGPVASVQPAALRISRTVAAGWLLGPLSAAGAAEGLELPPELLPFDQALAPAEPIDTARLADWADHLGDLTPGVALPLPAWGGEEMPWDPPTPGPSQAEAWAQVLHTPGPSGLPWQTAPTPAIEPSETPKVARMDESQAGAATAVEPLTSETPASPVATPPPAPRQPEAISPPPEQQPEHARTPSQQQQPASPRQPTPQQPAVAVRLPDDTPGAIPLELPRNDKPDTRRAPPPPPAFVEERPPPPRVVGEHRVVVHLREGTVKRGKVRDADLAAVALRLDTGAGVIELPTESLKVVFFMLAPGEQPPRPDGRKVHVTFADGRPLTGFTRHAIPDNHDFFLVPTDARGNASRIYVYRHAVRHLARD